MLSSVNEHTTFKADDGQAEYLHALLEAHEAGKALRASKAGHDAQRQLRQAQRGACMPSCS